MKSSTIVLFAEIQMLSNLPFYPQINHRYFQGDYRHHCQLGNCFDVIITKLGIINCYRNPAFSKRSYNQTITGTYFSQASLIPAINGILYCLAGTFPLI